MLFNSKNSVGHFSTMSALEGPLEDDSIFKPQTPFFLESTKNSSIKTGEYPESRMLPILDVFVNVI